MKTSIWHRGTVIAAVFFSAFSAVHLIDDFISDVPSEFNLGTPVTLFLAFAYMLSIAGLLGATSHKSPIGYFGLGVAGVLILLAQLLKSVPEMLEPGSWHLGLASEIAAIGLAISGAMTAVCSFMSWRIVRSKISDVT